MEIRPVIPRAFSRLTSIEIAPRGSQRFALALSALVLALTAGVDAAPARPAGNLKKVLVFGKRIPGSVEPYAAADSLLAHLAKVQGFEMRITTDSNLFKDDTLGQYQVIVWNNVMRNVLSPAQQAAFTRYMENGGGYVGFHAAATNRRIWPWYVDQFLGGDNHHADNIAWGASTVYSDTVKRAGRGIGADHYIMQGVPKAIPHYGEWYNWNPNPADNPEITVLQWYQPRSIKETWPQALPASWCREYGAGPVKGRLFYIQVSHEAATYSAAWYRAMVGNAMKWAARDEAGTRIRFGWKGGGSEAADGIGGSDGISLYRPDGRKLERNGGEAGPFTEAVSRTRR